MMEEILQVDMVNIPLFTGFHTGWVVSRISSINSSKQKYMATATSTLEVLSFGFAYYN